MSEAIKTKPKQIDYLHPNGVPEITKEQEKINEEEQKKPVSKHALEEADGHHMCSERCLGRRS